MMDALPVSFPYHDVAIKIVLALGVGLGIGLEREWAHKDIGVCTFAITALLGTLVSMLSGVCALFILLYPRRQSQIAFCFHFGFALVVTCWLVSPGLTLVPEMYFPLSSHVSSYRCWRWEWR